MYVLIDRDRLIFCHKHHEHAVVSNLATIEVAHSIATILPLTDPNCFREFTLLELRLLYQNTTGHKFEGFSHFHLQEMVLAVARALPTTDANAFEVSRQALACATDELGSYRYVKGAYNPARNAVLSEPPPLHAAHDPAAATAVGLPVANTVTAPAPITGPSDPQPVAPRKGARALIFEIADTMWNAAGNPMQLQKVLALRKAIMQELETHHGVKKSTSSTALGEWQKVRCPS